MKAFFTKTIIKHFCTLFFVAVFCTPTFAQQDIITVPNSEVLPFGTIILKDSNTITPKDSVRVAPSVIMGLGHGMDLAVGVPLKINTNDGHTGVKGEIGLKKVFFLGSSTRLTVGGEINPYLNSATTPDFLTYAHVTQKIKKTRTSISFFLFY